MKGTVMNKLFFRLGSVLLLLLPLACGTSQLTQQQTASYGFNIFVGNDMTTADTSYSIYIYWQSINESMPVIYIDGIKRDSNFAYPSSFQLFERHKNIAQLNYEIILMGDTLRDTIKVPPRIDSIYCNGKLLDDSPEVWVDSAKEYQFTWSIPKETDHFYIVSFFINGENRAQQIAPSYTVIPALNYWASIDTTSFLMKGYFLVEPKGSQIITSATVPSKRSGKLFAYYYISGARHEFSYGIRQL